MMVFTRRVTLVSEGSFYTQNVTEKVREVIKESAILEGMALVFFMHTTGAIMVTEHEAGILVDLENLLESIIPVQDDYKHHLRGADTNAAAHLRSALMNNSITVPVTEGDLDLGAYQEILVIDLDERTKKRTLVIKVLGN
ncbi:MAG: secondary thiamine-phosphate synthase enzyme YjbQ [Gammaproteobacteria bacterium]